MMEKLREFREKSTEAYYSTIAMVMVLAQLVFFFLTSISF